MASHRCPKVNFNFATVQKVKHKVAYLLELQTKLREKILKQRAQPKSGRDSLPVRANTTEQGGLFDFKNEVSPGLFSNREL